MDRLDEYRAELAALSARSRTELDAGRHIEARAYLPRMQELAAMIKAETDIRAVKEAESRGPRPQNSEDLEASSIWREIRSAMLEKRAITANGSGVNTVGGIVRSLVDGGRIAPLCSIFTGRNAQTNIPVFAPHLAIPVGSAPGATGTASDSTAVLTGQQLSLRPWYSTLPVGMDALLSTSIEAELPGIFSEAFSAAWDKAVLVGTGTGSDALGVFVASASGVAVAQDIACAAAGAPKWVDYVKMALELNGLSGDPGSLAIVAHPNIFNTALTDATANTDPYRNEYLLKGTILGIPLKLSTYCPVATVAGSYVAVGGAFKHYALAFANSLTIDPIKTVGSDNVTYQAFVYAQGKPMISTSFRRLKTV